MIIPLFISAQTLPSKEVIYNTIKTVNDHWQISNPNHGRAFWDNAAYHTGNMAAYDLTGISRYKQYSTVWSVQNEWMGAKSDNPENWRYSYGESDNYVLFGDWQICFQTYIDLYNLSDPKDETMVARAIEVMEYQTSTSNIDYWWWADGLYMVMPVMTKLYHATGEEIYLEKLYEYFKYAQSIMYDDETGLFYRDANYVYPAHTTNSGLKDFWARGDGWVFAGLAKIIEDMPAEYSHKEEFESIFMKMAESLSAAQQEEGYWTRSILDPAYAPGPETSGTAFFTFGFAWGINAGLLSSETYLSTVEKGWDYLQNTALQEDGSVGYVQPIGASASPETYVGANSTANFGVGAYLLAGCEVIELAEGTLPSKITIHMDSVKVLNDSQIQVFFNQNLNETTATEISNYSIEGATISQVQLSSDQKSTVLTISNMDYGKHLLYIQNIQNTQGDAVESNEWISFQYYKNYIVSASSYESGSTNYPENTIDNDLNTRWSAEGVGEWILFDLQESLLIQSLDLAFFKGNQRITFFEIETSTDGINYTSVYDGFSSGTTLELENFDFDDQEARYIRITGKGNSSNQWNSFTEIDIQSSPITTNLSDTDPDQFKLFPNPASDWVEINSNTKVSAIRIFDSVGKLKFNKNNIDLNHIDISNLANGYYFVQIETNNGIISEKLFIERE